MNQLLSDKRYEQAKKDLLLFKKEKLLTDEDFSKLEKHIKEVKLELSELTI